MFAGGIRPHMFCLPVLKREEHRRALIGAAISGNPKFFLGTDSAPHARNAKESACGCAGIYTAHAALELYAEAFEAAKALDKLEAFASFYGADFYGLPRNRDKVTLRKQSWEVPAELPFGDGTLVPLRAGESLSWTLRLVYFAYMRPISAAQDSGFSRCSCSRCRAVSVQRCAPCCTMARRACNRSPSTQRW